MKQIIWLLQILYSNLKGVKKGLFDVGDVDGITSAALFKIKYPKGVTVFAAASEVTRSRLLKFFTWDFVADLPCPGKAHVRADHHKTNKPCAEIEYYDPEAPCATLMALKALKLEGNPVAETLVKIATETDTANIVSKEAADLDSAVKSAPYFGKVYLANELAKRGLEVLEDEKVKEWIRRSTEVKEFTQRVAEKMPIEETMVIFFPRKLKMYYRLFTILLQKKGVKFILVVVFRGPRTVRLYYGANPDSKYDSSILAKRFGGGGHKAAAGATIKTFFKKKVLKEVLRETFEYLGARDKYYYIVEAKNGDIIVEKAFLD